MKRILIADDEATVIRVMQRALRRAGYDVETARNGLEALEAIEQRPPDVLVTDIEMPRMDGRELCQTIAQRYPQRAFPIFVVTSLTAIEHRQWSQQISNLNFLEKPVSIRQLTARLDEYFAAQPAAVKHG